MDPPAERAASIGRPSAPPIVFDTAILIALRLLYFALSRRYLLATLSPTLRELQKSDDPPLPTTSRSRMRAASVGGSSIRTGPRTPQATFEPLPSAPDTEDDDTDTAASSYPGSPMSGRSLLPGQRTPTGSTPIEMGLLGAKLRDAAAAGGRGGTAPRVIELAHSTSLPSVVGTRQVKRDARGLSRVARYVGLASREGRG